MGVMRAAFSASVKDQDPTSFFAFDIQRGTTQTSVTLYTRTSVTLFTFMKRLEVGVKEWLAIFCCVDGRA